MESISLYLQGILGILIFVAFWFVLRKMLRALSNRINNAELYKEDMLNVLEEIRDELKQLNQKNISK